MKKVLLAVVLIALIAAGLYGCGHDAMLETVDETEDVNFFGLDLDGDGWMETLEADTAPAVICRMFSAEEMLAACERHVIEHQYQGGGDCRWLLADDPEICANEELLDCGDLEFSLCAKCVNPGAEEVCDGIDNDCDGLVDEDCPCLSDADCGEGYVCGADHRCYERECDTDGECANDQVCESGLCVEVCLDETDCAEGQVCQDGHCVDDTECRTGADCAGGQLCEDGVCIPADECLAENACDQAFITEDGRCEHFTRPDCCLDDNDCDSDEYCGEDNRCHVRDVCIEDADCPHGLVCESGLCVECVESSDCPASEECRDNYCVDLCQDVFCDPGQVCLTGECGYPACDPANDLPNEGSGDCAPYRDEALATVTPPEGVTLADYGYGCHQGRCKPYEDPDNDEVAPANESWCADGVDGDLDGSADMEDPDCSGPPEPECIWDSDCHDSNPGTVDRCVSGTCAYCTPRCAGRECGPDGCGGSCGSCEQGETCSAAGRCVLPEAEELTVQYYVNSAYIPAGTQSLAMYAVCWRGSSTVLDWQVQTSQSAPFGANTTLTLEFTVFVQGFDLCDVNVTNGQGWWAARCEGIGGTDCVATGDVAYSYNGLLADPVGIVDNDQDGLDYRFAPGLGDSDGDGVGDEQDTCPFSADCS